MCRYLCIPFTLFTFFVAQHLSAQCWPAQTFSTAGEYTYTVPGTASDQYTITIFADGADGGDFLWGSNPSSAGGQGASISGEWVVSGGDQLLIIVGQSGFDALGSPGGGGGGGGTAVIINGQDVLIAAGAGGGGGQNILGQGGQSNTNSPAQGGGGPGASGGGGFNQAGQNGQAGTGGGAGTLTGQGLGGTQGVVAGPGGNGFGGGGGGAGTTGGGGGGYQGGDGASNNSLNGKGGNSFVNTLYSGVVTGAFSGQNGGGLNRDGLVGIECLGVAVNNFNLDIVQSTDPLCNNAVDGSITVAANMGTPPYTYSLNGGTPQASGLFDQLPAGTYTIVAQDNTGATASITETLNNPPALVLTYIDQQDVLCFGDMTGSITVAASGGTPLSNGGYNYYINNVLVGNSGMITGLAQGTYIVLLEDSNGCTDQLTVDILSNDEIVPTTVQQVDVSCNGGSDGIIEIDATGGFGAFTYSLNGLADQASGLYTNLTADTYTIEVTDGDGCTAMTSVTIDEPAELLATASAVQPSCSAPTGTATVSAMGGTMPYEYSIDGTTFQPNSTFMGLAPGAYDITVIDANNCTTMAAVMINTFSSITVMSTGQDPNCNSANGVADGNITLQVTGGVTPYAFAWTTVDGSQPAPNQQNQTGLAAGTYSVVVSDQDGCTESATVTLAEPDVIEYASQTTNISCDGGADGAIDITNLTGGSSPYVLDWTTTDGSGLQSGATMQTGLTAGTYGLIVTDSNGCSSMESFNLSSAGAITITTSVTDASCTAGGSVTIEADGGTPPFTYSLDGVAFTGDNTFKDLTAGGYMGVVKDSLGCVSSVPILVLRSADAIAITADVTPPSCYVNNGTPNGAIELTVEGGDGNYTYSWTGPGVDSVSMNQSELYAGSYVVVASDGSGCTATATYNLQEPEELIYTVEVVDVTCHGEATGSLMVTNLSGATPPVEYIYGINGQFTMSNVSSFSDLEAGNYSVFVEDADGCSSEVFAEVTQPDPLEMNLVGESINNIYRMKIEGLGGVPPYRYAVDDPSTASDQSQYTLPGGVYTFYVLDANDCIVSRTRMLGQTSTEEAFEETQVVISPNPASDYISIAAPAYKDKNVSLCCYSVDGRLLIQEDIRIDSEGSTTLDVRTLPSGLHFIVLDLEGSKMVGKVLVE